MDVDEHQTELLKSTLLKHHTTQLTRWMKEDQDAEEGLAEINRDYEALAANSSDPVLNEAWIQGSLDQLKKALDPHFREAALAFKRAKPRTRATANPPTSPTPPSARPQPGPPAKHPN